MSFNKNEKEEKAAIEQEFHPPIAKEPQSLEDSKSLEEAEVI